MDKLLPAIQRIANEAQTSTAVHPRCVVLMRKLFDESDFDVFWKCFSHIIRTALLFDHKKKVPYVSHFLDFAAAFCTSMERRNVPEDESIMETELLSTTFDFLLKEQRNADDNVRFHTCLFINKILDSLVGAELSVDIWDRIQECMLERTLDPRVGVRIQALKALFPLQCPDNPECPVIKKYTLGITCDPNANVRKLCVENVALRRDVIPKVILQSTDVSNNVRLAVYDRALKYPQHFKIIERQTLISNGINGGSEVIEKFVKQQLLPVWFNHWGNDYLKLAKALRLDANFADLNKSVEVIRFALKTLIRTTPCNELLSVLSFDEKKLVEQSKLDWESIIFWRVLLEVFTEIDEYDASAYMPNFIDFCTYINSYNDSVKTVGLEDMDYLQYQYILNNLFIMVGLYDMSDEMCRNTLNKLIGDILLTSNLQLEIIQTIINCLKQTFVKVEDMTAFVAGIMSDIIYNIAEEESNDNTMDNFEVAQLKVKLYELKHAQEIAIKEKKFLYADSLNKEIDELQGNIDASVVAMERAETAEVTRTTDPSALLKYLNICVALLSSSRVKTFCSVLRTIKDDVVQDLIMHENKEIRERAFKCYALFCLLDKQNAYVGIHLFCATIEAYRHGSMRKTPLAHTAVCAVVDFIRLYGADLMATPHAPENETNVGNNTSFDEEQEAVFSGGSSLTDVIQALVDLMQDENHEIQEIATRGLCNMLLAGRIHSPSVVSRLIIKWASPATDWDGSTLPQIIGYTLEKLLQHGASSQIVHAVVPTIKIITKAPKTSPLADIDVNNLIKFLLSLCMSCPNSADVLNNLATSLCEEMLNNPNRSANLHLSKLLTMVPMENSDECVRDELISTCDDIMEEVTQSKVLVNIRKFKAILITASQAESKLPERANSCDDDEGNEENMSE